ncbi:helix-turn-helix transcriptional regulator [Streptomyces sp. NPDC051561]|uniref:helix-turn-helix transcriptional regulator n=1 Tax=Streptomyces sp. NPDC051561 TaxID=3365658 RepID=UPI00378AE5D9
MISDTRPAITVLEGLGRINAALDIATAACHTEVRTLQPGGFRDESQLVVALQRALPLLSRGVHMRTLYQHTARHGHGLLAYVDRLPAEMLEVRTLEELVERLIIFDRDVAYLPVTADRRTALEIRDPHLIAYLAGVFDHLWYDAVPMDEPLPEPPPPAHLPALTSIRRRIAHLLVEGHVDEAIARRLGLHIRTTRAHIAKLADMFGSTTRAQLGYLIAKSGVLDT